ncbi:MAG: hypothetical protein ACYDHP_04990 [Ferrimicrobium sp.]
MPKRQVPNTVDGSALLLIPVITLIAVLLVAVLVDIAFIYFAQEHLSQVSSACAIQAADALSPEAFYTGGIVAVNPQLARTVAQTCLLTHSIAQNQPKLDAFVSQGATITLHDQVIVAMPLLSHLLEAVGAVTLHATVSASEVPRP